jgi:hypothetical protein
MTERMQTYRSKKEAEGMVQVRIWIPKEHVVLIKDIAKECRPAKPLKIKKRYGKKAPQRQIELAEMLAKTNGKEPPKHLYDYHISLSAWIRANYGNQ